MANCTASQSFSISIYNISWPSTSIQNWYALYIHCKQNIVILFNIYTYHGYIRYGSLQINISYLYFLNNSGPFSGCFSQIHWKTHWALQLPARSLEALFWPQRLRSRWEVANVKNLADKRIIHKIQQNTKCRLKFPISLERADLNQGLRLGSTYSSVLKL